MQQEQIDRNLQQMENLKNKIKHNMGSETYNDVYALIRYFRSQPNADEKLMYDEIKHRLNNNKFLISQAFQLDGMVFREILAENNLVHF